jgi:microcystin-dependent protein
MDEPYVGVIFAHAGTFAPVNWALCQGQVQQIANNEALFTLIGTTYGGDGQTTFSLPDLRGRMPVGQGQGTGLSNYVIGQAFGTEQVTLTTNQMPAHNHLWNVNNAAGNTVIPTTSTYVSGTYSGSGSSSTPANFYGTAATAGITLSSATIGTAGNSTPSSILQPILATNYIIALFGIFPSRN